MYTYRHGLACASPINAHVMHAYLLSLLGSGLTYVCICYACILTLITWLMPGILTFMAWPAPCLCVLHILCMCTYSQSPESLFDHFIFLSVYLLTSWSVSKGKPESQGTALVRVEKPESQEDRSRSSEPEVFSSFAFMLAFILPPTHPWDFSTLHYSSSVQPTPFNLPSNLSAVPFASPTHPSTFSLA